MSNNWEHSLQLYHSSMSPRICRSRSLRWKMLPERPRKTLVERQDMVKNRYVYRLDIRLLDSAVVYIATNSRMQEQALLDESREADWYRSKTIESIRDWLCSTLSNPHSSGTFSPYRCESWDLLAYNEELLRRRINGNHKPGRIHSEIAMFKAQKSSLRRWI